MSYRCTCAPDRCLIVGQYAHERGPPSAERQLAVNLQEVIATVNRARAAYGAARLEHLPSGMRLNPSHCPLARAFRTGVSDRLFFALGSERLRVEAIGPDPAKIADAIRTAWYGPRRFVEGDPIISIIRMPPELCAFVKQFDASALPDYVGAPDRDESAMVAALARQIADAKATDARTREPFSVFRRHRRSQLQNLES